jgi:hypothetical protein
VRTPALALGRPAAAAGRRSLGGTHRHGLAVRAHRHAHQGGQRRVGLLLVALERQEDVSGGVQRTRPDQPQPREVQQQQREAADDVARVHLGTQVRDRLQRKGTVALEFHQQDGGLVVPRHGLRLQGGRWAVGRQRAGSGCQELATGTRLAGTLKRRAAGERSARRRGRRRGQCMHGGSGGGGPPGRRGGPRPARSAGRAAPCAPRRCRATARSRRPPA